VDLEKRVSTIDQRQTLRQILERTLEYQIETHHLFIDTKTAYDKVNRNQLYKAMLEFGIPPKLVRLTRKSRWRVLLPKSRCKMNYMKASIYEMG